MSQVVIIGGGPSGMTAACAAARNGHSVVLFEKNEKLGKKLFITGKGRCNVTNACDEETFFSSIVHNRKFLYSAYHLYDFSSVMEFFEQRGCRLKVERGNRVFPASDHSSDIIACLTCELYRLNVDIRLHSNVLAVLFQESRVTGVKLADGSIRKADAVIVATGGLSYPSTGSTGDGYRFAKEAGHSVIHPVPSLVPFEVKEEWVKRLQGLSLKNVRIEVFRKQKRLYEDFGEMLFTHFGVSGPLILSASAWLSPLPDEDGLSLSIDLKPALNEEQLDKRILRDFGEAKNKQFKNALDQLLPSGLIPEIVLLSGIDPLKKVNEISKAERRQLLSVMKHLSMTITGCRGFHEAIITKGGVSVKELDPSSMQSKQCHGLYFCGEILDLDAVTGGFNLQIAWSTGFCAGNHIEE